MPKRKHIFKAKRKDNGEWVEGYLMEDTVCSVHGTYLAMTIHEKPKGVFEGSWNEVDPETVCEYTGLTDKNGTKIFEGDILSYTNEDNELRYVTVVFCDCAFLIEDHGIIDPDLLKNFVCLGVEIAGNIYDNPELLEVTNNEWFTDWLENQEDYGLCDPPLDAQRALYFLCDYLLGEDWSVPISESVEQTNTAIVFDILEKYSHKFRKELRPYWCWQLASKPPKGGQ